MGGGGGGGQRQMGCNTNTTTEKEVFGVSTFKGQGYAEPHTSIHTATKKIPPEVELVCLGINNAKANVSLSILLRNIQSIMIL